jgi:hypothetical protein
LRKAKKYDEKVMEAFKKYPALEEYMDSSDEVRISVLSNFLNIDTQEANRIVQMMFVNKVLTVSRNVYKRGDRYSEFMQLYEDQMNELD